MGAPRQLRDVTLLRRSERIVIRDDEEPAKPAFVAEPAYPAGPPPDRRNLEQWLNDVEKIAATQGEAERRGLDALRAEVQRTLVTSDGEVISGSGAVWRQLLRPSRLALLAVAVIAGGVASYFAATGETPVAEPATVAAQPSYIAPVPPSPPPAPLPQILVASRELALGERLSAATVEWKSWPVEAMRDDYVVMSAQPRAVTELNGAIARFEFFPGEPIRTRKLAIGGEGYLSAVLQPGERGVSIRINPETAAGGFVQPNDHVDVLLTRMVGDRQVASTLLENVRVLAIDHRVGDVGTAPIPDIEPPEGEKSAVPAAFGQEVIATLVLDAAQAEVMASARAAGSLSLVLRSIADFKAAALSPSEIANQRIRLTSPFWK
jgi:pilus assembly protein CpaB